MVRPLIALVTITAAVSGCGDEAARDSAAPAATATATATATAEATAEATATPADAGSASAKVAIKGFTFTPARVTVRRGGQVTWDNKDASNHTVTFAKPGPDDVGNLRAKRSAKVTFEKSGSYAYICEFHPGMAGTVEVR